MTWPLLSLLAVAVHRIPDADSAHQCLQRQAVAMSHTIQLHLPETLHLFAAGHAMQTLWFDRSNDEPD